MGSPDIGFAIARVVTIEGGERQLDVLWGIQITRDGYNWPIAEESPKDDARAALVRFIQDAQTALRMLDEAT